MAEVRVLETARAAEYVEGEHIQQEWVRHCYEDE